VHSYHELRQIIIFYIVLQFTDCQCMNTNATEAYPGPCKDDCDDSGFWYIALFSLFVFIHSTSEVGSMLLILRCVHPQDKAMALGLIQFAIGLFGESNHLSYTVFLITYLPVVIFSQLRGRTSTSQTTQSKNLLRL